MRVKFSKFWGKFNIFFTDYFGLPLDISLKTLKSCEAFNSYLTLCRVIRTGENVVHRNFNCKIITAAVIFYVKKGKICTRYIWMISKSSYQYRHHHLCICREGERIIGNMIENLLSIPVARRLHLLSTGRQSSEIGDKINDPHFGTLIIMMMAMMIKNIRTMMIIIIIKTMIQK